MSNIYVDYELGGNDGVFDEVEAVRVMTDEWIAGNNYCEQTVTDLRDALIAAQHRMHLTAFGAFCGGAIFGMFVMLILSAFINGGR